MPLDSLLKVFIHRIVRNLVPPSFDPDQTEALFEELVHLIENDSETNTNYSLSDILSEIQSRSSTNSWLQLQRNLDQLLKYKDQASVSRYLSLLNSLILNNQPSYNNISNRTQSPGAYNYNMERPSFLGSEYQQSLHGQTIDSFENINFDKFSDRRSVYSVALTNRESRTYSFQELLIPYFEDQLSDSDFLKYVSYTLAGVTSDILPVRKNEISLPDQISNGLSGELHLALEIALIYQKLANFTQEEKLQRNNSQVKVAALSFIEGQLDHYLGYVNQLSSSNQSSLKSIYADLYDELVKLRFLNFISTKLSSLLSYELLSTLHNYSKHGDSTISECSLEFLKYCVSTFSKSISTWILEGEINESFEDFFITNESLNKFNFRFQKEKLPSFFSQDLALMIYNIGLTNRFIKLYCRETKWINEFSDRMKTSLERERIKSNENDIILWNSSNTQRLMSKLHNEIINYFNHIIYNKFHYFEIITALKDYLLMGKGDFIENLIINGNDILNEPSNSLSGYQLSGLLRQSVLRTRSRYDLKKTEDSYILNNLDARLLSVGHGNIGWDVFTLDYRIEPPLSTILDSEKNDFKKDYLRVFNHLWKIKRLEHLYAESWREAKQFKVSLKDKKFKRFKLVQNFFYSFIKSIKSYILNDVIKIEFNKFVDKLQVQSDISSIELHKNDRNIVYLPKILKPNLQYLQELNGSDTNYERLEHDFNEFTIDQMKLTHHEFLSSIIKHKLINGSDSSSKGKTSGKTYVSQLNSLINTAFRFILTMVELHGVKYDAQYLAPDIHILRREGNIYDNLLKLFQDFNSDLKVFVADLNHDDEMELRYLGISLNQ